MTNSQFLHQIQTPDDLKRLDRRQLSDLATELRHFILTSVAKTGGHLSSNLGTVELTLALHYIFNTPHDRIVWDVGHQTYAHKILTGRRDGMSSLRQQGGISGFPKRTESEFDAFGTAHSSTSISAAIGMATASRYLKENRKHIAVIGDGAMTAGMAFEALNNGGISPDLDLLVILNDNDMSISPPVGALNQYLARLMSGSMFETARHVGRAVLSKVPPVLEFARRFEEHTKGMLMPATMFEEFGFHYYGPIDGHDLDALIPTLQNLKAQTGPRFLHIVTRKGNGYQQAEQDPVLYHGPGKFDPQVGIVPSTSPSKKTFTQVFSDWICDMGRHDTRLLAITPAMREGSGLVEFEKQFPQRYFDVGIAEQHAVTFAAGIACEGLKPVVAIYSTFLQRGYDQLVHDVALQNLDVTFAIDRAGLVGADGATHAGNYDIAFMRCIPNMVIATPSDEHEARLLLSTCYQYSGPAAVRYPRGSGSGADTGSELNTVPLGKAVLRRTGESGLVILAFGTLLTHAMTVGDALNATVVDMRFVKPLDTELLNNLYSAHRYWVSIEDGCLMGGAGSAVAEYFNEQHQPIDLLQLAYPDRFIDHGDQQKLHAELGLDATGIKASVTARWGELSF